MDKENGVERVEIGMIRPKRTVPTTVEGKARTELEVSQVSCQMPGWLVRLHAWWEGGIWRSSTVNMVHVECCGH